MRLCDAEAGRLSKLQQFREPLYLKDKPVRIEDTRSEEECKYPQLFRSKLEGENRVRRRHAVSQEHSCSTHCRLP